MKIRLIRHATLLVEYAGRLILIDPLIRRIGEEPNDWSYARPLPDIPEPLFEQVRRAELVALTKLDHDHADPAGYKPHLGRVTTFVPSDTGRTHSPTHVPFLRFIAPMDTYTWKDIRFTPFIHETTRARGVCGGYAMQHEREPSLLIAGDTTYTPTLRDKALAFGSRVVVVNAGDERGPSGRRLTMDGDDVCRTVESLPNAVIVAVHMDAMLNCRETRRELRDELDARGLLWRVSIPADGENLSFYR